MTDISLRFDDVACIRGERLLFSGLSERVDTGGCLVLTGRNGCGKSTLLRVVAGLSRPFAGLVRWEHADSDRDAPGSPVGYVGHRDGIKAALTPREHLDLHTALHHDDEPATAARTRPPQPAARALETFALTAVADLPGRFLSSGQRRRLALARLLVAPSLLWVLDEPAVGLDREGLSVLERVIRAHREAGGLVVLSTHTAIDLPGSDRLDLEAYTPTDRTVIGDGL